MYPSWRVQIGNESPTEFEQSVSDQLKGLVEDMIGMPQYLTMVASQKKKQKIDEVLQLSLD